MRADGAHAASWPRRRRRVLARALVPVVLVALGACVAPEVAPEAGTKASGHDAVAGPAAAPDEDRWRVVDVVDGDTIDVRGPDGTIERVRLIGIDTPERGRCGYGEASLALADLVVGSDLVLVAGARDDRDRYDRLLRYVDVVTDGARIDAGRELLRLGLARARYDSRDGYGAHPREADYVTDDEAAPDITCSGLDDGSDPGSDAGPGTGPGGTWRDCAEARAAGAAPVRSGDPGYGIHLDGDRDGVGCEGG